LIRLNSNICNCNDATVVLEVPEIITGMFK